VRRISLILAIMTAAAVVPSVRIADAAGTVTATAVVQGLTYPSSFTVAPDGRIFWTEWQTGVIGVATPATGAKAVYTRVSPLCNAHAQGLFGVAMHPDYPAVEDIFVFATRSIAGVCFDQVLRIAPGGATTVLLSERSLAADHVGGRVLVGPDRNLWVSTGDGEVPANSQDPATIKGKILRMTLTGGVPAGNPTPGSVVFATGIRNVFGFNFDRKTGLLWAADNGPECNDEINLIEAGGNYGWGPTETCSTPPAPPINTNRDGPSPRLPQFWYSPPDGPTGAVFCSKCGIAALEGNLVYGGWLVSQLRALTLDGTRRKISGQSLVYTHQPAGNMLSVETGPDGWIYFSDMWGIYRLTIGGGGTPTMSVNDTARLEGNTGTPELTFTVTLDRPSTTAVTVHYATSNGSAKASKGYVATSGTLTIPPGTLTGSVKVVIKPNTIKEKDKTLRLTLTAPTGASIIRASGVGTILNDD
jgi:glucose/arabinose dehydrogenase